MQDIIGASLAVLRNHVVNDRLAVRESGFHGLALIYILAGNGTRFVDLLYLAESLSVHGGVSHDSRLVGCLAQWKARLLLSARRSVA